MSAGSRLDGVVVDEVFADLTARRDGAGVDLTSVRRPPENAGVAFMGDTKGGSFDIPGELAREWLRLPANPNGRTNADVLKPWVNGMDLTAPARGEVDRRLRLDDVSWRRGTVRRTVPLGEGTRLSDASGEPTRSLS